MSNKLFLTLFKINIDKLWISISLNIFHINIVKNRRAIENKLLLAQLTINIVKEKRSCKLQTTLITNHNIYIVKKRGAMIRNFENTSCNIHNKEKRRYE